LGLENATPRDAAGVLIDLFGTTEEKGSAIFFDALPVPLEDTGEKIEGLPRKLESGNGLLDIFDLDIMNPHYGPYYQNGEPPGDWHNPVPVIFLVVREGIPFIFGVGGKKTGAAENILKLALKHHGVGAKTALGYGRFGAR
jgi:CRISPR-associated protein Cmr6